MSARMEIGGFVVSVGLASLLAFGVILVLAFFPVQVQATASWVILHVIGTRAFGWVEMLTIVALTLYVPYRILRGLWRTVKT